MRYLVRQRIAIIKSKFTLVDPGEQILPAGPKRDNEM